MPLNSSSLQVPGARGRVRRGRRLVAALAALAFASLPCYDALGQIRASRRGNISVLPNPGAPNTPINFAAEIAQPRWATADHPLFHSSYMGEEDVVVANSRYGPVTSRDLYLWLILREGAAPHLLDAYRKAKTQVQKDQLAKTLRQEIDEFVFTNYAIPEIMGNAPCDAVAGWREQLRLLPAYQLVYLQKIIRPRVCIQEADRVKYLKDNRAQFALAERARVRYIRLRSTFNEPIEEQDRVEARMVDLRQQIAQGDITFAEAARQHSQAPSAARGGEIPPIRPGELFFFFDEAVAALEPGEVSAPFRGPDGSYYIVQLLERLPAQEASLKDPAVACRVDEGLWRKVLRAEYEYANRRLFERQPYMMLTSDWDSRCDDDLVAGVGVFGLNKRQVRDLFPIIEGENLQRRDDLFGKFLTPILERAAMAAEVVACGHESDPVLQRARWMVGNLTRRDSLAESCECALKLDDGIVRSFWKRNPELFTPMPLQRIFRISLVSTGVAPSPESLVTELARVLTDTAAGRQPTALPPAFIASPGSVIDQVLEAGGEGALSLFAPQDDFGTTDVAPIELDPAGPTLDIRPLETTGTLTLPEVELPGDLGDAGEQETTATAKLAPSLSRLMATRKNSDDTSLPKVGAGSIPQVATTVSSASQTSTTVELSAPKGGAAPAPVGGGMPPASAVAPVQVPDTAVPTRTQRAAAVSAPRVAPAAAQPVPVDLSKVGPNEAVPNPCCPPMTVAPEYGHTLGDFLPEDPPVVPCPSSIPFNPDLRFPKISAREVTELFSTYVSPEFSVRVEDLGYMYAQDRADIPKTVAGLEPGTFTFPLPSGTTAVSYFVANSKRPARPAFEEIKARVYMTYRSLKVNECLDKAKKEALGKAGIEYRF